MRKLIDNWSLHRITKSFSKYLYFIKMYILKMGMPFFMNLAFFFLFLYFCVRFFFFCYYSCICYFIFCYYSIVCLFLLWYYSCFCLFIFWYNSCFCFFLVCYYSRVCFFFFCYCSSVCLILLPKFAQPFLFACARHSMCDVHLVHGIPSSCSPYI